MSLGLPHFNYHPNPLETGNIEISGSRCLCCNLKQGYIYIGPVIAGEDLLDKLCPWCIQNGSAHQKFRAIFTQAEDIAHFQRPEKIPDYVLEELSYRTPGFYGWVESKWWTHCGDAAIFLGSVGLIEIETLGPKVIKSLRDYFPEKSPEEFMDFLSRLTRENSPTAYLFQCRRCAEYGIYADEEEQAPN